MFWLLLVVEPIAALLGSWLGHEWLNHFCADQFDWWSWELGFAGWAIILYALMVLTTFGIQWADEL